MMQNNVLSILFVDDEPDVELLMKNKFRKALREGTMQFRFAEQGEAALKVLESTPGIDLLVTDINMPVMDGLTLLSHVHKRFPILKTIIVSAYGDMDNIRTAMNRGAFDFVTKPIDFADLEHTIQKTYQYVLDQRETLRAIRENDILKMYVDGDVLRFMADKSFEHALMSSENIEATVAFFDIAGYTAISERFPPDMVVNMLNSYFDVIARHIQQQGGVVDKFIGDCIMAVFRGDRHLYRAVDAALAIRAAFRSEPVAELDGYAPGLSIGINSGTMVSGNIGSRSIKRLDYTVIGDVVNTASRMQSSGGTGQIVVSAPINALLQEAGYETEEIGTVTVKNKAVPIQRYNVASGRPATHNSLQP